MEVKPGYKRTEVGVIPEDWEVVRLDELANLYQPKTISAKQFTDFGFPVYGANGIVGFYDEANHETWQVTVTCRGSTCGTVNRTVSHCWITGNAMVLNCDHNDFLDKEFFYHLVCSQELAGCITGTGQPQIVRTPLAEFRVALPPLKDEQQAIAEVLSDADALLESLEQLLAKTRDLKQGALQELLSGKKRLPDFTANWKIKKFSELAQPRKTRVNPRENGPYEFCIELEHLESNSGHLLGTTTAGRDSSLKSVFQPGDVLFGKLRAYLRKYWLATCPGVCSTEIWVLVANSSEITPEFLFQLVRQDRFIELASFAYGTHMPRSDWHVIKSYEVQLPDPAEQTAIAAILSDLDAEIAALEAKRAKVCDLKQGLMQELLTGRTRLVKS